MAKILILTLFFSLLGSLPFFGVNPTLLAFQSFFAMLVFPLLAIRLVFKDSPRNFGFRLPENKKNAAILAILAILILLPVTFFFSALESFRGYYPAGGGFLNFIFLSVILSSIYYVSEEFLFRGFLFWRLFSKIGYHSFWVTNLVFALLHFAKPILEIPFAFFAGLIFSYLSWKTKSFLPAAVAHFVTALILNAIFFF
ncbi:MAG: type II CAAX endopeptidase family protein [Patescibacteria group bacterium]